MIPLGNVLVVDDEQASFEMYRDVLTPEGYKVEWAADRASALSKLHGSTWDVVVLDQHRGGRCRLGFFVAVGGFTEGFHTRSATFRKDDVLVVPMGPNDLDELVMSKDRNEVLKKLHARAVMSGNGH